MMYSTLQLTSQEKGIDKISELLEIEPAFNHECIFSMNFVSQNEIVKKTLLSFLPKKLLSYGKSLSMDESSLIDFYEMLFSYLPLISFQPVYEKGPYYFSVILLCQAKYTDGIGRFIADMVSSSFNIPNLMGFIYNHAMAFNFVKDSQHSYFFQNFYASVSSEKEYQLVKSQIHDLLEHIRLTALSVQSAREILSLKETSKEQKRILIQENISAVLKKATVDYKGDVFHEMQNFIHSIMAEDQMAKVQQEMLVLTQTNPSAFDQTLFHELSSLTKQMTSTFIAERDEKHLSRINTYHYLFKRTLSHEILENSKQRYVHVKILKAIVKKNHVDVPTVSCLCMINIIDQNEFIDEMNLFGALEILVSNIALTQDSVIVERSLPNMRFIYLEIHKKDLTTFTFDEIQ